MNHRFLTLATLMALASMASAQDRIYRCGNEYTNNASVAKDRNCKLIEGGNVTVVEGFKAKTAPAAASAGASSATSPANAPRVDSNDQRARDNDARAILEAELRKAESRHADLLREYNGGNPERTALELRNVQVYQERIAALKASIARSESDIAGIRRELGRLAPAGGR